MYDIHISGFVFAMLMLNALFAILHAIWGKPKMSEESLLSSFTRLMGWIFMCCCLVLSIKAL